MKIIPWLITKGGINIKREYLRAELRDLAETSPQLKLAVRRGSGHTLDELALMAVEDGYLFDADPLALLGIIEHNAEHPYLIGERLIEDQARDARRRARTQAEADKMVSEGFYGRALAWYENAGLWQRALELETYLPLLEERTVAA